MGWDAQEARKCEKQNRNLLQQEKGPEFFSLCDFVDQLEDPRPAMTTSRIYCVKYLDLNLKECM